MGEVRMRVAGTVIPFQPTPSRRARAAAADGDVRGQILLFTGVRYERMPEAAPKPAPEPSPAVDGSRGGRRRRRS